MRILATADVHIGRRSTRLPAHLDGHPHSCATAWQRIVDTALAESVDALVVAGDLVDQANRYFEAVGPVEAGVRQLAAAGIETVVVAGNHDFDVLPALVDTLGAGAIRLLGRGGKWERYTLQRGSERLHIDGWSFPDPHVSTSPLEAYRPTIDRAPVLALVHVDLDQAASRYAPVFLPELRRYPEVLFVLGHIHVPRHVVEGGGARFVYPGSPQALDPGETGPHGVHLIELGGGGIEVRQLPISSVRYDAVEVSVDGAADYPEVESRIVGAVRTATREVSQQRHLRSARFRLRLQGRTRYGREIEGRLSEVVRDLEVTDGAVAGSVEAVRNETLTAFDLDGLATSVGAPALLAAVLRGEELPAELRTELRRLIVEVHGSRSFVEIGAGDELERLEAAGERELRRAATQLLDELLAQKEVA